MDVHGGKGIQLGPRNYLGRGYQVVPVAITVEGANILTRILIIFGQGAIRCHPFVLKEMNAARNPDRKQGVDEFDRALFGHIGFTISNAVRSFVMALTHARFTRVPDVRRHQALLPAHRALQRLVRVRGRRRDAHARRLPQEEGEPVGAPRRRAVVHVSRLDGAQASREPGPAGGRPADRRVGLPQSALQGAGAAARFPAQLSRIACSAAFMRALIFPRGRTYSAPSDRLGRKLADAVLQPDRGRATACAVSSIARSSPAIRSACCRKRWCCRRPPSRIEKRIRVEGVKTGKVTALDVPGQIAQALAAGIISETEAAMLRDYDRKVMELISVDDFDTHELGAQAQVDQVARR